MTDLKSDLISRILATGPIPVSEYMAECLMHPKYGYYQHQQVFGGAGDFVTAPEISQMFGEMIGLSLAQSWINQGSPTDAILLELGPGRGTLMADILRATKQVGGFDQLDVHFVETSANLRGQQKGAVPKAIHHDTVFNIPDRPILLVANEFFDALPIRQFQRAEDGWSEIVVGVDGQSLRFGTVPQGAVAHLEHRMEDTSTSDIVETCDPARQIVDHLTTHISTYGGCGLIIDYGDWRSLGDTMQAITDHKSVHPLSSPGLSDLTAHVDFESLFNAARCTTSRITPQGVFLERLGITTRAQALAAGLSGQKLENHIAAHRRLTHPDEMGTLFKVMGLAQTQAHLPPGLEV